ncbi:MAG: thioesterase family protein [Alphaproteobacteria bacterium]|nr:thioesterase family protein [Alphaproteobacteria bacterium]
MSEFVSIYRGGVNAWECDIMGHFNVQFYAAKLSEGMGHLGRALGLTPAHGIGLRQRRNFNRYLGELHAGDLVDIRAAVLAVDADSVDLLAEVVNGTTGQVSATFEVRCVGHDPAMDQARPWPQDVRQHMTAMIAPPAGPSRPATAGGPVPVQSGALVEPFISSRGMVAAWHCDPDGQMSAQHYYRIGFDGIGYVRHRTGVTNAVAQANKWGGAALEYALDLLAPIGAGDQFTLRSGLLDLGGKTFRFGHCLYNDSSGTLAATYDVIGCMLDLQARRAMTIPGEIRARSQKLIIPWPPGG